MKLNELLRKSKHTRQVADKILNSTNLDNILSKFGYTQIIGSYKYDLMYDPDIDIIVETDNPRISSVGALNELVKNESFAKYEYGDFVKYPMANRPHGYIIVLKIVAENIKWEIEIWFLEKRDNLQNELDALMAKLTKNQIIEILKLKAERKENGIDKKNLSSVEIYKKVLISIK